MEVVIQFKEATENSLNVLKGSTIELEICFKKKSYMNIQLSALSLNLFFLIGTPSSKPTEKKFVTPVFFKRLTRFWYPNIKKFRHKLLGEA